MQKIKPEFKKDNRALYANRMIIFIITFLNYAILHACRSVWSTATQNLDTTGDKKGFFTTNDISNINTAFLASYGIGGFFTGQLADKVRKRFLIFWLYFAMFFCMTGLGLLSQIDDEK